MKDTEFLSFLYCSVEIWSILNLAGLCVLYIISDLYANLPVQPFSSFYSILQSKHIPRHSATYSDTEWKSEIKPHASPCRTELLRSYLEYLQGRVMGRVKSYCPCTARSLCSI